MSNQVPRLERHYKDESLRVLNHIHGQLNTPSHARIVNATQRAYTLTQHWRDSWIQPHAKCKFEDGDPANRRD